MAEQPPAGETPPETPPTETEPKPTETVDFWKTQARENEKRAKANADAAKRLAELEESQKTESQRLADRTAAAEAAAVEAQRDVLRYKVIAESQLDPDLHEFVTGETEDEMRAKVEKLKARATAQPVTAPRADLSQGSTSNAALNGDPLLRDLKSKLGIS